MKKVVSLAAIIGVVGIVGVSASAAQDGAAYNTKASLIALHTPVAKVQASFVTSERLCPLCKVPMKITEQVATKPGHGVIQETVFVDQCPGCGGKMAMELKQTKYVHTCSLHCCGA